VIRCRFSGSPVLLFFAFKFSQELRMLQKALVLVLVFASVAGLVSCGKTASHFVYAAISCRQSTGGVSGRSLLWSAHPAFREPVRGG